MKIKQRSIIKAEEIPLGEIAEIVEEIDSRFIGTIVQRINENKLLCLGKDMQLFICGPDGTSNSIFVSLLPKGTLLEI